MIQSADTEWAGTKVWSVCFFWGFFFVIFFFWFHQDLYYPSIYVLCQLHLSSNILFQLDHLSSKVAATNIIEMNMFYVSIIGMGSWLLTCELVMFIIYQVYIMLSSWYKKAVIMYMGTGQCFSAIFTNCINKQILSFKSWPILKKR